MGMLDDAIREHLELKKRSGAPDEEIKRLEHEAFGPVRSAAPAEPVAPEPQPAAPEPQPQGPPAAEPEPEPAVPAAEEPEPADADEELWFEEPADVPVQPTAEFTAAEAADAGGAPPPDYVAPDDEEPEDVLEETPEFLQETPEHDRLWFEQKPPRDFDFDK